MPRNSLREESDSNKVGVDDRFFRVSFFFLNFCVRFFFFLLWVFVIRFVFLTAFACRFVFHIVVSLMVRDFGFVSWLAVVGIAVFGLEVCCHF